MPVGARFDYPTVLAMPKRSELDQTVFNILSKTVGEICLKVIKSVWISMQRIEENFRLAIGGQYFLDKMADKIEVNSVVGLTRRTANGK